MNKITITHKDDLVFVPLANSDKAATLDANDFQSLMAKEVSPRWTLSQAGKVMTGKNKTVARLICEAGKGQHVKYADEDPTNLRRSNLVLTNYSKRLIKLEHIFDNEHTAQGKTITLAGGGGLERSI